MEHAIRIGVLEKWKSDDGELDENSVVRKFRITASDGKSYSTSHYNLKAIIAVGNKVDSPREVQFRKWANEIIKEFTIKGYTMDDERLKTLELYWQKTILKIGLLKFYLLIIEIKRKIDYNRLQLKVSCEWWWYS